MYVFFVKETRLYWVMVFLLIGTSCTNPKDVPVVHHDAVAKNEGFMSSIPAKRVLSYWDGFNFKVNVPAVHAEEAEQKLVDFMSLFATVPDTVVQVAIQDMLSKAAAEPKTFSYFVDKYSHYLYDPNSPMRNEGYYEKVLNYLVKDPRLQEEDIIRYETLLDLVRKNQVGMTAANFEYLLEDGSYREMHAGTKPYKMLVFYDPTCTHCAAIMLDLAQTPAVRNCIENDFLDVVSVSLHPDKESWEAYQQRIPDNWINGWDEKAEVINGGLYNIRAYPTIFLLDANNVVLLKDAPHDVTLRYLANLVSP